MSQALLGANVNASQAGTTVLLEPVPPPAPQPVFVCTSLGTPPQIGAPGVPDCPLQTGGAAPGGSITGIAFLGPQMYAVTDTGGLFRIVDSTTGTAFGDSNNVADYIDGSQASLKAVNDVMTVNALYGTPLTFSNSNPDTIVDPNNGFVEAGFVIGGRLIISGTQFNDGEYTIAQVSAGMLTLAGSDSLAAETVPSGARLQMITTAPVQFSGLVAGPQNAENGRYENLLFGITATGRIFAFDTWGRPQAVFANAQSYVETGLLGANGLAFSNLDDNLWHVTTQRATDASGADPGHAIGASFDGSRLADSPIGNTSLYFGYEGPLAQSQFGTGNFAPNTPTGAAANTYDFPGGAQGTLISNPFSLAGYSAADKPVLYFDYWLESEAAGADDGDPATSFDLPLNRMRDAFRVYVSGDDGYHTYRIPSVIVTAKGTVLAFCEGRKAGRGDAGDIDMLVKRSSDGGRTFSEQRIVWDDGPNTCGNPCPVVDRRTGTIWLATTHNLGHATEKQIVDRKSEGTRTVWLAKSTDDGLTWSRPVEITESTKKPDWTWYATGPGSGIQLQSGRLVIPCDHIATDGTWSSHVIYSDDGGATWKLGGSAPPKTNECEVVELADGRLMLNMRNYNREHTCRAVATSDDGGLTWSEVSYDETLVEPVCQAGIRRLSFAADGGKNRILFSNPGETSTRKEMTIRLSLDEAKTWPVGKVLWPGPAAYSSLAVMPDGTILCLYERGLKGPYEKITLARFGLEWLAEGREP